MYVPKHFSGNDDQAVRNLIEKNGFVIVLSFPENELPFINHLPVVFSSTPGQEKILLGHMAKRNPQWMHFKKNSNCIMIVNGPHSYITPNWYTSGRDVPTWNYAVAHLYGKIELIESFEGQIDVLKQITDFYEKPSKNPWDFGLPDDLLDAPALTAAIISFKFHIEKVESKFKLSQNRGAEDRQGVLDGLAERTDDLSREVREMMLGKY